MKKGFTGVMAAVCLLILTLLPAGAFAESVTFEYGKDNSYGQLSWDGDQLILDVFSGDNMPDEIFFDLKGNSDSTVIIRLKADVKFSDIYVQNQSGHSNPATIRFVSGDAEPYQVQVANLHGTGANNDKLIVGSGIEMTVNYIGLGASGGADSYLTLEEGAKLTFESINGSVLLMSYITLDKGAVFTSHSTLYEDNPKTITFSNSTSSADEKFIIDASPSPAIILNSNNPSFSWLDDLMKQNNWHIGSYSGGGSTLYDESDKIVTSFTVYNHSHKPQLEGYKEPTCTEDGYSGDLVCDACGEIIQRGTTISALGHNYENGVCTICGALDPDAPTPTPSVTPRHPQPSFHPQHPCRL